MWTNGRSPDQLKNRIPEYFVPEYVGTDYNRCNWMATIVCQKRDRCTKKADSINGSSVKQRAKYAPLMDFRELNKHIDTFTADADVWLQMAREWQQQGINVTTLDLRKPYLKVHIHKLL